MEYLADRFDRYRRSLTCFSCPRLFPHRGRDPSRGLIRLSTVSPRRIVTLTSRIVPNKRVLLSLAEESEPSSRTRPSPDL